MKILYCGNFYPSHSTETHIAKTLRQLGHEVIECQEDRGELALDQAIGQDLDLFLFTRTWGETVKLPHLQRLRERGIPSASFHLDLYVGLQRDGGINTDPFWQTDYVFTPDGDPNSAKVFKKKGINHVYLKPAVLEEECYLAPQPLDKEVIFVGSYDYHPEYPYRQQLINWLKSEYAGRFELWGGHGMGSVRDAALNQLYGRTKIVVGDSLLLPGHTYYWSDRAYETLGRGGFLIHPFIQGMQEEFRDAVHLRYYEHGNFKQLKHLIDYYLSSDEEREKIRLKGHEQVKNNCTYTQRMQQMLEIVCPSK